MRRKYNVIVIGLGIVGSASLWRLSCLDSNVLGIDSGAPVNLLGSSHGASRIFRQAYWEGATYLPWLSSSDVLWRELDSSSSKQLVFNTGGLFVGSVASGIVPKSAATALQGNVDHTLLSRRQVSEVFPAFHTFEGMEAVYEQGAYTIAAEDSKAHMLNLAVRNGAEIRFGASIIKISRCDQGMTVQLEGGDVLKTNRIILAIGFNLSGSLIDDLSNLLQPVSVPVYWFKPKLESDSRFSENFPAFLYQLPDGRLLYGTPEIRDEEPGIKIGFHNHQQIKFDYYLHCKPVCARDIEQISETVSQVFPSLNATPYASKKCVYTMSRDGSFIVGESRDLPGVFYVSACSGHGFKFATGLGDMLAKAALNGTFDTDVSIFSANRFAV